MLRRTHDGASPAVRTRSSRDSALPLAAMPPGVLLLDGVHLVAEALDAGVRVREAAVSDAVASDAGRARRDRTRSPIGSPRPASTSSRVTAAVMDALSPVRSPSAIVAIADRPAVGRRPGSTAAAPRSSSSPSTCRIPATSARSCASPRRAAPPAWSPPGRRPIRSAGRRCADRWAARCACRSPSAAHADQAVADARRHGCRIVATVPRGGRSLFDDRPEEPIAVSDRRRRTGPAGVDRRTRPTSA